MNWTAVNLDMLLLTESTPTERAALLTYWLASGRELTTVDVADNFQVSQRTAQRLFTVISRAIPIYRDDETGLWRMADDGSSYSISPY